MKVKGTFGREATVLEQKSLCWKSGLQTWKNLETVKPTSEPNMGVTIQCYRARIGTFTNNHSKMKVKSGLSERNNFKSDKGYATLLVYIFLFVSVSITLTSQSHEKITSCDIKVNQPCIKHQNIYHPLAIAEKNFEARYLYGNRRANGIAHLT